jgi:hypothetical protein
VRTSFDAAAAAIPIAAIGGVSHVGSTG